MLVYCTIELTEDTRRLIEKESEPIFIDHQEFLWYGADNYRVMIYAWQNVETDLVEKLTEKVTELVSNQKPFYMFGLRYAVKIGTRIDIQLDLQEDRNYRDLVESLQAFFNPGVSISSLAHIALARYKIPSKQQYSHIKNQLEKIKTDTEIFVDALSIMKVTQFGNGINKQEEIAKIPLLK